MWIIIANLIIVFLMVPPWTFKERSSLNDFDETQVKYAVLQACLTEPVWQLLEVDYIL